MNNVDRWNKARFTRSTQINGQAAKIEANRSRYEAVSAKTGVPWDVIGVIHYRESSGSFAGVLVDYAAVDDPVFPGLSVIAARIAHLILP